MAILATFCRCLYGARPLLTGYSSLPVMTDTSLTASWPPHIGLLVTGLLCFVALGLAGLCSDAAACKGLSRLDTFWCNIKQISVLDFAFNAFASFRNSTPKASRNTAANSSVLKTVSPMFHLCYFKLESRLNTIALLDYFKSAGNPYARLARFGASLFVSVVIILAAALVSAANSWDTAKITVNAYVVCTGVASVFDQVMHLSSPLPTPVAPAANGAGVAGVERAPIADAPAANGAGGAGVEMDPIANAPAANGAGGAGVEMAPTADAPAANGAGGAGVEMVPVADAGNDANILDNESPRFEVDSTLSSVQAYLGGGAYRRPKASLEFGDDI